MSWASGLCVAWRVRPYCVGGNAGREGKLSKYINKINNHLLAYLLPSFPAFSLPCLDDGDEKEDGTR